MQSTRIGLSGYLAVRVTASRMGTEARNVKIEANVRQERQTLRRSNNTKIRSSVSVERAVMPRPARTAALIPESEPEMWFSRRESQALSSTRRAIERKRLSSVVQYQRYGYMPHKFEILCDAKPHGGGPCAVVVWIQMHHRGWRSPYRSRPEIRDPSSGHERADLIKLDFQSISATTELTARFSRLSTFNEKTSGRL
jgi:hypothetical protein